MRSSHVVLVLDTEDRPTRLDLHFMMHNQGTKNRPKQPRGRSNVNGQ